MKLKKLADIIGAVIEGNPEIDISGVSALEEAEKNHITYIHDRKYIERLYHSRASAVIVNKEMMDLLARGKIPSIAMLVVNNPQLAFAKTLEVFYPPSQTSVGVSDRAFTGFNVTFGTDVSIYPFAYISDNVKLGARVTVSPGVFIGSGVVIGDDTYIYPNVTIREKTTIGKRVILHSGTVIGSDGFGYAQDAERHYKIPQVGTICIENDVEIGANVTIDRATLGDTVIGCGTKIDNLVQIAHNVKIGKHCIIVSQVGIGGSVEIGDGAILAGQVGIRDHVKVGKGAMIGAKSGVSDDIPDRQICSGIPAIPHRTWLRAQSIYAKLPEYIKRLKEIERTSYKEE